MSDSLIEKVLEHYGADLHRTHGTGWRPIKCPFHDDRMASGSVNLDKGAFRCHACGVKGDAIGLIKTQEGIGYVDALRFAEDSLGAVVGDISRAARGSAPKRQPSRWREKLFQ